jgi:glycosyltransferase involved in cell wall biosynthesis
MIPNSNKIKFSLIIPVFNEEDFLPACVRSVQKQLGNFEIEIIVVDNNSTDHSFEIAKSLGVKVLREVKKGVGQARKTGTENAQGELIMQLDADTQLPENYLIEILKRFEDDKNLVCLGGQMYFYDGRLWQNFLRPFFHYWFWLFAVIFSAGRIGPMGNNMVFKKEIYNKTSGFDAELKFGEDMDLAKKLSYFGKVKLDMSLKFFASARRFVLNRDLWIYILNFYRMLFLGKPLENNLPKIK